MLGAFKQIGALGRLVCLAPLVLAVMWLPLESEGAHRCEDVFGGAKLGSSERASLSIDQLILLRADLDSHVTAVSTLTQAQLLRKLEQVLTPASYQALSQSTEVLSKSDLVFVLGYTEFIRKHGLSKGLLKAEVRVEGQKAYVLVPIASSFVSTLRVEAISMVHTPDWAHGRFIGKPSGPSYLVGQFQGMSKFGTLAEIPKEVTKGGAIELLGLQGYSAFATQDLFVVRIAMNPDLVEVMQPLVPLIYKWRGDGGWVSADNFLEGAIPGFTSGGMPEVVFKTVEISARSLDELARIGVTIRQVK